MLTCHAEQWGHNGVLLYNSTVARIRLEVLSPLMLGCLDWWCGWEIIIFVLLVVGLFILVACCGIYFFFGTRGQPYNVVMYDSEENKASQQQLIAKSERPTGIPEPVFATQTASNKAAFAGGLNKQVDFHTQQINEFCATRGGEGCTKWLRISMCCAQIFSNFFSMCISFENHDRRF